MPQARSSLLALLLLSGIRAMAFDAFFSDPTGQRLGEVWEGHQMFVAVRDAERGDCGIAEFSADIVIFDVNTGAYLRADRASFRELGGIGSGLFFWVDAPTSNSRVSVQLGSRWDYGIAPAGQTHWLGRVTAPYSWTEGAWAYIDENVLRGDPMRPFIGGNTDYLAYPRARRTARVNLGELAASPRLAGVLPNPIQGRFENLDTVVLIVADRVDQRNVDFDQLKIKDTQAVLRVLPAQVSYGCAGCADIVVRIEDADENLNCSDVEYVPFFVIVNPGGWNPDSGGQDMIHNFCELLWRGGVDVDGSPLDQPIRWYNIYDEPVRVDGTWSRWLDYPDPWLAGGSVARLLFFAAETQADSGVFEFNFGRLEDLQAQLGFARFTIGTTIAFHYMDPNDPDDIAVATIQVGSRPRPHVSVTDSTDNAVSALPLSSQGLYVRVVDSSAVVQACCTNSVVAAICNPSNDGDCEYVVLDEVSLGSGVFFSNSAIPLVPVWDSLGGYQLVFDDWRVQAFNEDKLLIWYSPVKYLQEDVDALGDSDARR